MDGDAEIAATRGLTDKPFGVNFHMYTPGAREIIDIRQRLDHIIAQHTGQDYERVRKDTERDYFMSAEDLTTQAGLSVQQDLALVNLLGIGHVERNGHHYVNGMAALPLAEL